MKIVPGCFAAGFVGQNFHNKNPVQIFPVLFNHGFTHITVAERRELAGTDEQWQIINIDLKLSPCEEEVLRLLAKGHRSKEIAAELASCSER